MHLPNQLLIYEQARHNQITLGSEQAVRQSNAPLRHERVGGETTEFVWRAGLQPGATHRVLYIYCRFPSVLLLNHYPLSLLPPVTGAFCSLQFKAPLNRVYWSEYYKATCSLVNKVLQLSSWRSTRSKAADVTRTGGRTVAFKVCEWINTETLL
jgi:hypothetical protein